MKPRQLDLLIVTFSYGGNGGLAATTPRVGEWLLNIMPKMAQDDRIGRCKTIDLCDTPITMTRNQAVYMARQGGFDLLLMIDSDIHPDLHLEDRPYPGAKPFWETSFDFVYRRYDRGPVMVAAPYCGPPPHENVYCFHWDNRESDHAGVDVHLVQYTRTEAFEMAGMQEAAAIPTGITLWDIRLFKLTEPKEKGDKPWFYYDYTDRFEHEKCSTEDVTASRDVSLAGCAQLGYNPVFVNWDAWAGHIKQKTVGRPMLVTPEQVSKTLVGAADRLPADQKRIVVDAPIAEHTDWSKATRVGFVNHADYTPTGNGDRQVDRKWERYTRRIFDTDVVSWGFQTGDADLEALTELVWTVRREGQPLKVAEVGSWVGESALALLRGIDRCGGAGGIVNCIDHWDGSATDQTAEISGQFGGGEALWNQFRENVSRYMTPYVTCPIFPYRMSSEDAVGKFGDDSLDLVFIDADHTYRACRDDISRWLPKVRPGGILCGHDYNDDNFLGVTEAVHDLFARKDIEQPEGTKLWVYRVPQELHVEVETDWEAVVEEELAEPSTDEPKVEDDTPATQPATV